MSADNYYVIRRHPEGGFAACMYFASDEEREKEPVDSKQRSWPTLQDAYSFAKAEMTEYGVVIAEECW